MKRLKKAVFFSFSTFCHKILKFVHLSCRRSTPSLVTNSFLHLPCFFFQMLTACFSGQWLWGGFLIRLMSTVTPYQVVIIYIAFHCANRCYSCILYHTRGEFFVELPAPFVISCLVIVILYYFPHFLIHCSPLTKIFVKCFAIFFKDFFLYGLASKHVFVISNWTSKSSHLSRFLLEPKVSGWLHKPELSAMVSSWLHGMAALETPTVKGE